MHNAAVQSRREPRDVTAPSVGVADSTDAIDDLAGEWGALFGASSRAAVFLSPSWIRAWYDTLMPRGSRPAVVWTRNPDGALSGVLALSCRPSRLPGCSVYELAGEAVACGDHQDLLLAPGARGDAAGFALLEWIGDRLAGGALFRLRAMDADARLQAAAAVACSGRPPRRRVMVPDTIPQLELPGRFEEYEAQLAARRRKAIRRNRRQLERDHAVEWVPASGAIPDAAIEEWMSLHDRLWSSRRRRTALAQPALREFIRRFAREAAAHGWLRLYRMRVDGDLAAGLLVFRRGDRAYYYQSAWDPALADYGVGELVVTWAIRDAIEDGAQVFDFLRGAERYKFRLRARPVPAHGCDLAGRWPATAMLAVGQLRDLARRRLHPSARDADAPDGEQGT